MVKQPYCILVLRVLHHSSLHLFISSLSQFTYSVDLPVLSYLLSHCPPLIYCILLLIQLLNWFTLPHLFPPSLTLQSPPSVLSLFSHLSSTHLIHHILFSFSSTYSPIDNSSSTNCLLTLLYLSPHSLTLYPLPSIILQFTQLTLFSNQLHFSNRVYPCLAIHAPIKSSQFFINHFIQTWNQLSFWVAHIYCYCCWLSFEMKTLFISLHFLMNSTFSDLTLYWTTFSWVCQNHSYLKSFSSSHSINAVCINLTLSEAYLFLTWLCKVLNLYDELSLKFSFSWACYSFISPHFVKKSSFSDLTLYSTTFYIFLWSTPFYFSL